jgi:hypothetical protein
VVTWIAIDSVGPARATEAWAVGATWLGLTVAFEFLGGHYLFGNSWERLLVDYNIVRGRVWILVLLTTLVAPRLAASWQGILRPVRSETSHRFARIPINVLVRNGLMHRSPFTKS